MFEDINELSVKPEVGNSTKPLLPAVPSSEVYLEDCVKALKRFNDNHFDLAIVDPPYGLERFKKGGSHVNKHGSEKGQWNNEKPTKEYFDELKRVSTNYIIWGANYYPEHIGKSRGFIVWQKPYMDGMHTMGNCELAFTSFDCNARSIPINRATENRIHVTQKPIALYRWLLKNYAKEGNKILDTHLGSGSIAIACYDMGFDLTGYEIDKEYFDAAVKRLDNHKKQLTFI